MIAKIIKCRGKLVQRYGFVQGSGNFDHQSDRPRSCHILLKGEPFHHNKKTKYLHNITELFKYLKWETLLNHSVLFCLSGPNLTQYGCSILFRLDFSSSSFFLSLSSRFCLPSSSSSFVCQVSLIRERSFFFQLVSYTVFFFLLLSFLFKADDRG